MKESKISVRYAKALFLSASEKGIVDRVREDMEYILKLSSLEDVRDLLESPVINNAVKRKALTALIRDKVHELTFNLVMLTVNNNRDTYLAGIARNYIDEADRFNGVTKALLTSAIPLDTVIIDRLTALLEKSLETKMLMEQVTDPEITGGFILKIEDRFIDGSIRTQLRKIKKELTKEQIKL